MDFMKKLGKNSVDLTLTDIPYDSVNRDSNGLRILNKGDADIITFDLDKFLSELDRITKNTVIIFCGKEQFSSIHSFYSKKKGTTRGLVWEKSNPSPMNGKSVYLSGIELAVWFKKRGASSFNAHCKNTVFRYPIGSSKLHPTEKNHKLLAELIEDNSCKDEIVFDPCCGSGAHLLVAKKLGRKYIGVELNEEFYSIASKRLEKG